jgi:hypothetical protein
MLTRINFITNGWRRLKNHCRTTDNKDFTENDATPEFKKKLLISEHSPIRLLEVDWAWKGIKYWVSTEWSRHKFEKFISTQRDDRLKDNIDRDEKGQGARVNFDGYANAQNLIDVWRKRLCFTAHPQARKLAEDFKITLKGDEPELSNVLVPNCIYRSGCPEFKSCKFYDRFIEYCEENDLKLSTIQERYDAYNQYFYELNKSKIN